MEAHQSAALQYYYAMPEVHHANILHDSNNYLASTIISYVDVVSHNDTRHIASAGTFDNAPHHTHNNYGYYSQESISIVNSSSFDATSNIQHVNIYLSVISSQYMVPPQDLIFQELNGLYSYLVITTLLMKIKPLQVTKEGCLPT
jgi:hypothetical protein